MDIGVIDVERCCGRVVRRVSMILSGLVRAMYEDWIGIYQLLRFVDISLLIVIYFVISIIYYPSYNITLPLPLP